MKLEALRENVFSLTATSQELSALIGASRMSLDTMRADPNAPPELVQLLERILREYDAALRRLKEDGRPA